MAEFPLLVSGVASRWVYTTNQKVDYVKISRHQECQQQTIGAFLVDGFGFSQVKGLSSVSKGSPLICEPVESKTSKHSITYELLYTAFIYQSFSMGPPGYKYYLRP
ncbi:hypothetical protein HAX54_049332 [Datura stramonium]|uniref:Uncharacterized protein n=1 Tax=Datura stramonium TaxID=4076 RepID=A0ABS8WP51_DATST|nr:hypothetical protein [Datura stramonium]